MLNVAPIFTIVVQISKLRIQVNLDTLIWLEVKLVCWNTWFSITCVHNLKIYIFIYLYLPYLWFTYVSRTNYTYIFQKNNWIEISNSFFFVFHLVNNIIRISKIYHGRFNVQILNRWKLNLSRAINFKFETR